MAKEYRATCFCGAVEVHLTGEPAVMGYCHCDSCRQWSASPVNAFTLWKADAVHVARGAELLTSFNKTENSKRQWCKKCGGHVFTAHPAWGLVDVYAAVISDFEFAPALHVNYQESVLRMRDGLPKQKDVPKELGGSGVLIAE